jgi:hypothetical protein
VVKRLSTATALLVTGSLLFVSIVYACSGMASMQMGSMSSSIDSRAVERGPCSKHKQDICKSVRHKMLSLKAPSPVADIGLHVSTVLQSLHREVPLLVNLLPTAGPPGIAFHPILRFSFPFSKQVLRI